MQSELSRLAVQYWPITSTVVSGLGLLIWNTATNYTNFKHMRSSMVTKKDLRIAILEMDKRYATKEELRLAKVRPNGGGQQHGYDRG